MNADLFLQKINLSDNWKGDPMVWLWFPDYPHFVIFSHLDATSTFCTQLNRGRNELALM